MAILFPRPSGGLEQEIYIRQQIGELDLTSSTTFSNLDVAPNDAYDWLELDVFNVRHTGSSTSTDIVVNGDTTTSNYAHAQDVEGTSDNPGTNNRRIFHSVSSGQSSTTVQYARIIITNYNNTTDYTQFNGWGGWTTALSSCRVANWIVQWQNTAQVQSLQLEPSTAFAEGTARLSGVRKINIITAT